MNRDGYVEIGAFEGACQCGAVRFRVSEGLAKHTVCHCRMCQRATGNAFAPLVEVDDARIDWTGEARLFQSSNIAERGFCATCGTPLFYRGIGRGTTEFMVGTIDTDLDFRPIANHGIESRRGWIFELAGLTERETFFTEGEHVVSHQYEHGE